MMHLMVSAVVCAGTFALVATVATKFDERPARKTYGIAAVCVFIVAVVLVLGANNFDATCFGGGATCSYNDNEPLLGLLLLVFAGIGAVKSWFIYSER